MFSLRISGSDWGGRVASLCGYEERFAEIERFACEALPLLADLRRP